VDASQGCSNVLPAADRGTLGQEGNLLAVSVSSGEYRASVALGPNAKSELHLACSLLSLVARRSHNYE